MSASQAPLTADLVGVRISAVDLAQALDCVAQVVSEGRREYICTCPVYTVMQARESPAVRAAIEGAALAVPDGMGVVWALRLLGHRVGRVYGPDLTLAVCQLGLAPGWRHYFYGGQAGVAEAAAAGLAARCPGLVVAGTRCPPFRSLTPAEKADEARAIQSATPDVVWVGLGSPKQDLWCAELRPLLEAPMLIGVGAAFDYFAGAKRQAPPWLQKAGLEWVFRLLVEPRRLWRRYLVYNPRFVWQVFSQFLRKRLSPQSK